MRDATILLAEAGATGRRLPGRKIFPLWLSLSLAAVVVAAIGVWLWFEEGHGATLAFSAFVTGALLFTLGVFSRRPFFSAGCTAAIVAGISTIAAMKRQVEGMVFHSWDFVQTLLNWTELRGEFIAHKSDWLSVMAAALIVLVLLILAARAERPFVARAFWLAPALLCAIGAGFAGKALPERGHTLYYWNGLFLTSFYRSFGETAQALWRGGLFEVGALAGPPIPEARACRLDRKPPHIVLIHEESLTPPSVFPGLQYDHSVDPFFRSDDGRLHSLRVETYGGASWLTQFSVLAGVSSRSFGSMSNFVQPFMRGRLRETVPQPYF